MLKNKTIATATITNKTTLSFTPDRINFNPNSRIWSLPATDSSPVRNVVIDASPLQRRAMKRSGIDVIITANQETNRVATSITVADDNKPLPFYDVSSPNILQQLTNEINKYHAFNRLSGLLSGAALFLAFPSILTEPAILSEIPLIPLIPLLGIPITLRVGIGSHLRQQNLQKAYNFLSAKQQIETSTLPAAASNEK